MNRIKSIGMMLCGLLGFMFIFSCGMALGRMSGGLPTISEAGIYVTMLLGAAFISIPVTAAMTYYLNLPDGEDQ